MMLRVAIDYDNTLVDRDNEWLPGAEAALRAMHARGHKIIIHSARANYPAGRRLIEDRLGTFAQRVTIYPKPEADIYIDDRAHRFTGWSAALTHLRYLAREHT